MRDQTVFSTNFWTKRCILIAGLMRRHLSARKFFLKELLEPYLQVALFSAVFIELRSQNSCGSYRDSDLHSVYYRGADMEGLSAIEMTSNKSLFRRKFSAVF